MSLPYRFMHQNLGTMRMCLTTSSSKSKTIIDITPKTGILVVQGNRDAKAGRDTQADWGDVCGPNCSAETNTRGIRFLEFATFNNLVLKNTLGPHKHLEDGPCTAKTGNRS